MNDGWYLDHPKMHDMMAIVDHDYFIASAIVWPSSTEEVQLIVRWANKYKIPIYPFSIGRNLGYGGSARKESLTSFLMVSPSSRKCCYRFGKKNE